MYTVKDITCWRVERFLICCFLCFITSHFLSLLLFLWAQLSFLLLTFFKSLCRNALPLSCSFFSEELGPAHTSFPISTQLVSFNAIIWLALFLSSMSCLIHYRIFHQPHVLIKQNGKKLLSIYYTYTINKLKRLHYNRI